MKLLYGRSIARDILHTLAAKVAALGRKPKLAVMLVGDDPASQLYVSIKCRRAAMVGIETILQRFEATTPQQQLIRTIEEWNNDPTIDGILIQLPLPVSINTDEIINVMNPSKDVDGFHPATIKRIHNGDASAFLPPVHQAVLRLIDSALPALPKTHATILGNSTVFVEPLRDLLGHRGIAATIIIQPPDNPKPHCMTNIVITALGRPRYFTATMIETGAIVIDVGTTRLSNGSVVGDVDRESVREKADALSPVPGGVGPLTIAYLLSNVVKAAV